VENITLLKSVQSKGWKNERVVTAYPDGAKVIQVVKGDPTLWWKRVKDVLAVVDFDLGFVMDDSALPKMEKMVRLLPYSKIFSCKLEYQ
jgi:hypothetical protein